LTKLLKQDFFPVKTPETGVFLVHDIEGIRFMYYGEARAKMAQTLQKCNFANFSIRFWLLLFHDYP
jgi:hypothetical protein